MGSYKIFAMASNHPDPINKYWGLFIKWSIEAISKNGVDVKAIIPRPYSLPFSRYSQIPLQELDGPYPKYYPRYWYLLPKRIFYGLAGSSYSNHMYKFLDRNFAIPDLVHAHHIYLDGYGVLKYCKEKELPLVTSARGTIVREIVSWRNIQPKIMETLAYSSKILCVSYDLKQKIEEMGVSKNKVIFLPSGTDIKRFDISRKNEFRKKFAGEKDRIILFVGQLTKKKGVETLMKVSEVISKKYNKYVKFIVVGNGVLRKKIKKIKNIIVTGNLSPAELSDLFVAADIFVLPSLSEGRPNVIYEAMASECPIVATNVGGIPEQVKNGYNGFLVEPQDFETFAARISYLLDDEDFRIAMGKNGRKRLIEKGWNWDNYAKEVIDVYKQLI